MLETDLTLILGKRMYINFLNLVMPQYIFEVTNDLKLEYMFYGLTLSAIINNDTHDYITNVYVLDDLSIYFHKSRDMVTKWEVHLTHAY